MFKVATLLHYCSNDYRFLNRSVQELRRFSSQIIIPYADRFFNGEEEDKVLIDRSLRENLGCTFVEFAYHVKQLYSPFIHSFPGDDDWINCWHSTSRYVGRFFVRPEIEWVLFLDADEILEGDRFAEWLEQELDPKVSGYWFSAYTYGLRAQDRKEELQQCALLIRKDALTPHQILNPNERYGMYQALEGKKRMQVVGLNGKPMMHHYSWVRSEEERAKKAATWGKRDQRDWLQWLDELNAAPFEPVEAYFDPLKVVVEKNYPNLIRVDRKAIIAKELEHAFL